MQKQIIDFEKNNTDSNIWTVLFTMTTQKMSCIIIMHILSLFHDSNTFIYTLSTFPIAKILQLYIADSVRENNMKQTNDQHNKNKHTHQKNAKKQKLPTHKKPNY